MQNTPSCEAVPGSVGFSQWGRTSIASSLEQVGIKRTWQQNLYSTFAGRIGFGGEAWVRHPDYDKQWDLGYNRNLIHAFAALLLWCLFVSFIFFQLFTSTCDVHNLTTCITSQRTQTLPWDETVDSSSAVVYIRSMNKHLSLEVSACLITNGDYNGYKQNLKKGRIHPVQGGCALPNIVNLSSEHALTTLVSAGGCKLFEKDNAYRTGWCHKVSSPVVGQFGDPAFRFVKINVKANVQEMFVAGNYTNLDFIYPEFVGGKKDDYNSVYYTFDPFYPMKKEMFFQRNEIVKHSSLEFLSSSTPKAEKAYLQYHHEYNRWERSNIRTDGAAGDSGQIRSNLLAEETLTVASIYLRATSSRIVFDERQVKTLYDFPKDAGGFWTASLFLGACGYFLLKLIFPKRVADFSELMRRTSEREVDKVRPSLEMGKQQPTYGVSLSSSTVEPTSAYPTESNVIELSYPVQDLEKQAFPAQSNDDHNHGLCGDEGDEIPRILLL